MVNWFNSKVREYSRTVAPMTDLTVVRFIIAVFKTAHRDQRQLSPSEGGSRKGLFFDNRATALDVRERCLHWFADQGMVDDPKLGQVKTLLRAGKFENGCTFDIKVTEDDLKDIKTWVSKLNKKYASVTYQK